MKLAMIRPPMASFYSEMEVREDTLIAYFLGYLRDTHQTPDVFVFDYVLDKHIPFDRVIGCQADAYVICVRESGTTMHYARRLGMHIANRHPNARILFYGHQERLQAFADWPENVTFVTYDELHLADALGFVVDPRFSFERGLTTQPYCDVDALSPARRERFRAALETSRGCHFRCRFCFINQGDNFARRWSVRPIDSVVRDLRAYYQRGYRHAIFLDSEFIGADRRDYKRHVALLKAFESEFPQLKYMIYNRADTLARFGHFDLLKRSGLACVFIGVESFVDQELSYFKKGLSSKMLKDSINTLMEHQIYMFLSLITFNRLTTVASLRKNIGELRDLHAHPNHHYLGLPGFVFNFECNWVSPSDQQLSTKTYIRWMVWKRMQPGLERVAFNTQLEPYIEVCRLFSYEVARKSTTLNTALPAMGDEDAGRIDRWYSHLGHFALIVMDEFLTRFEDGDVRFDNLGDNAAMLFDLFANFNMLLPKQLRDVEIRHESLTMYRNDYEVDKEDHGWDAFIPLYDDDVMPFKVLEPA